jgi:hypothetical protein
MQNTARDGNLGRETVEKSSGKKVHILHSWQETSCSYEALFLVIVETVDLVKILRALSDISVIFSIILQEVTKLQPTHLFPWIRILLKDSQMWSGRIMRQIFTWGFKFLLFNHEAKWKVPWIETWYCPKAYTRKLLLPHIWRFGLQNSYRRELGYIFYIRHPLENIDSV